MSELDLNLLFAEWLEKQSEELMRKGSKLAYAYSKALDKLKKHEEPIVTAKQLRSIQFVGEKLLLFLCAKLKKHCKENSLQPPVGFENYVAEREGGKRQQELDDEENPKKKTKRNWVPKRRSGSWAILVSLLLRDKYQKGLRKEEIITGASAYCDSSFTSNPSARDFYSAWEGVKTLLKRELVECVGRAPKVYLLTDTGAAMAELIVQQEGISQSPATREPDMSFDNGVRITPDSTAREHAGLPSSPLKEKGIHDSTNRVFNNIAYDIWSPEDFDIVLLFDNREVRSQTERDFFQRRITSYNVECDVRALSVGDVLWIARHKQTKKEVVLNYVCERKRLDDLAMSIKDGRFMEQKNRLRKSGIRNVYYIVEEGGLGDVDRIMEMKKAIETSISMVMTVSNLFLQRFRKTDDTIEWLVTMTEILKERYSKTRLLVLKSQSVDTQEEYLKILEQFRKRFENRTTSYECVHTFLVFQATLAKTNMMTVKEMFTLMLMLVRGISLEKAAVIQNRFGTPRKLIEYYLHENQSLLESEKGMLMANMFRHQIGNKNINKAALVAMYEAWGKK